MTDYLQVSTATETKDQAVTLARSAVQARLAAGAQITGPVISAFWHDGTYGEGEEYRLTLTTTADRYPELEAHLTEHHPWRNPEVRATALTHGAAPYLQWIDRYCAD